MDEPKDRQAAVDRIVDLWAAVFGEPPTLRTDIDLMIAVLVDSLPTPTPPITPDRPCKP